MRAAILAAAVAALVYLPTLAFKLVWDDTMLVELTHARLESGGVPALLASEFTLGSRSEPTGYFRPVVLASLAIDGALGGGRPWVYHATNILLHALVTGLSVLLLRRVLDDELSALAGGLLFAVHPVHVEAVAFVSGRTDLLAALFVLASCLLLLRGRSVPASASLAAGALSKESALMLIPVWLAWDGLGIPRQPPRPRAGRPRNAAWLAGAAAAVLVALALRWATGVHFGSAAHSEPAPLVARLATYLKLLAVPWPMSAYYTASDLRMSAGVVVGALAALAVFAAAIVWPSRRIGLAAAAWTLLFLIPVLGVVRLSGGAAAERFLYLPSLGFCLAAAALWRPLHDRFPWPTAVTTLALLAVCSGLTVARSRVWHDEPTLYADMARTSPRAFVPHFNLGNELAKLGRTGEAEAALARAVEIAPDRADGWNNLGTVRLRLGKDDEAERAFAEAIRLKPDFALARDNAALVRKKRFDELTARGLWADAVHRLERDPNAGAGDVERLISAARALNESGHWAEAEQALKLAIRFDPNSAIAHGYLGFIRFSHHRLDEAIPELVRAVELDPNDANPRFSLALARMASGDAAGARAERDALAQVDAKRAADLDAILNRR